MKKTVRLLLIASLVIVMSLTCFTACDVAEVAEDVFEGIGDFFDDIFGGSSKYGDCEHDWHVEYSEPSTCKYQGYETYWCSNCGEMKKESLPLGDHVQNVEYGYAATCTSTGLTDRITCERCGELIQQATTIDAKGHTPVTIEAVAPTCTTDGYTEGKECSDCGEILEYPQTIDAAHTPEVVEGYEATCTTNGLSDGSVCSVCDEILQIQQVIYAGHVDEYIPYLEPTCTQDGHSDGWKCSRCGEVYSEPEVYPAGHDEYISENGYEATCTENGKSETVSCYRCDEVVRGGEVIPAAHKEEVLVGVAATCSSTGLTDGKKCTACGEITVEPEVIEKLSHTVVSISGYDATCSSNGLSDGKFCSVCGNPTVTQHTIAATGHTFGENGQCTGCTLVATADLIYTEVFASSSSVRSTDNQPVAYTVAGLAENSQATEIVIPDTYNGLPVIGIDANAFSGNTNITRVILTASIVSVGDHAFSGCTALEILECADFEQTSTWSNTWFGYSSSLKIKAPKSGDKTPYDIYLEAMNATQHDIKRYIMTSTSTATMSYGGNTQKMLEITSEQRQYYDDCYYKTTEIDYGSSSSQSQSFYYVGGYYYDVATSQKFRVSKEAWRDMMTVNREDMPELTERYFKQVEFTKSINGSMYLSMILDADYLRQIMVDELGPEAAALQLSDTEYNYCFSSEGYIYSYTADMTMSMGPEYTVYTHSSVVFSQVNTYNGPSAPAYGYTDVTEILNSNCSRMGHKAVECEQVDATCFGEGWTAYSYCSRCFQAIDEAETIEAAHKYENGECTECGAFEDNVSRDLAYELKDDGTGYILVGIGDCKDTAIIVPEYVYGRPVITVNADAFVGTDVEIIYIGSASFAIDEFAGCEDTSEFWQEN